MFGLKKLFKPNPKKESLLATKDEMARILKTSPEALAAFEASYQKDGIDETDGDFFAVNSRRAAALMKREAPDMDGIIDRIVDSLVAQTLVLTVKDGRTEYTRFAEYTSAHVTREELRAIPEEDRPWLTGEMMKVDISQPSGAALCWYWDNYLKATDPKTKKFHYDHFRQGLDILDLDPVAYAMIGTNPNSMGHWLPQISEAAAEQGFFKIPDTTVIRVPITLLQLTRQPYEMMNAATLAVVDRYCMKVFGLDTKKEYFIKTGTYSSKFDFRNCRVRGEKEVRELGEYLLYIHYQALQMAGPLVQPHSIYGVSTTDEWVVREFIPDRENRPQIYKGMPLRTEFRLFVDFDTKEVLGISPYWEPNTMKQRFGHASDSDTKHNVHDYVIYAAYEETLMADYEAHKQEVMEHVAELAKTTDLTGQWSLDIMKDGDDYYVIDMALAINSAHSECVPAGRLHPIEENWLPQIPQE